ncbi:MAG: DUF308 domain-containing protein [Candidatus Saccharibacteria bacterium]|nr:DUF308 domain-containing protein [Candidatus Saccharibacteria bacterium]
MSDQIVKKIEVKGARKIKKFSMPISLNVILLALGLCLVIWADKVTSLISIVMGVMLLVVAAYDFIAWYRVENRNMSDNAKLVTSIVFAIAGGFLIINNGFLKELISIVIGIFLLIEGILRLQDTLNSKSYNKNFNNSLILAFIGIVCGALCLFGKIIVPDLMIQVIGIMLIIFAIVDATGGIMISKSAKSAAKTVNAKIVDEK